MASKRDLKKVIKYVCSELLAETVASTLDRAGKDNDNANALMRTIILIHNDYVCRISHPEPGKKAKDYFRDIRESLNVQVSEIIDQINNLN